MWATPEQRQLIFFSFHRKRLSIYTVCCMWSGADSTFLSGFPPLPNINFELIISKREKQNATKQNLEAENARLQEENRKMAQEIKSLKVILVKKYVLGDVNDPSLVLLSVCIVD